MNHKLLQRSVLWLAILACGLGLLVSKSPIPAGASIKSSSVVVAGAPGPTRTVQPANPGSGEVQEQSAGLEDDYAPSAPAVAEGEVLQAPVEEIGR